MPNKIPISKQVKEKVLQAIQHEGLSGFEAPEKYGIKPKNIYRWLSESV